ncbi:MAG: molybdate ABC transporter substrate-binding protein [Longimicrobiales bacterium]
MIPLATRAPGWPIAFVVYLFTCCSTPALGVGTGWGEERWAPAPGPAQGADSSILVLAAASLTDVLPRVAALWEEENGLQVRFSFDATSRVAPQILQGAPGDLFFSADVAWMDWVAAGGGIQEDTRVTILGNELVLVVPEGGGFRPDNPEALTSPRLRRLALAGENVPAGRYAQAALETAGVWGRVESRVVRAGNVRGTLEWVARGEVEAGVVYRTDARTEPRVRVVFAFPRESHPPITYPAAVVHGAPHPRAAREFLTFCQSEAAREIFRAEGFSTPSVDPPIESVRAPAPLPDPWSAVRLSLLVAMGATLVGFVPAVWLGWVLARKEFVGKTVVATIALIPLVLPPVVTGFLLLSLFGTQGPLGAGWRNWEFPFHSPFLGQRSQP